MSQRDRTNGELLLTALTALDEYVRRGNKQLDRAHNDVAFEYQAYLGLKSLAAALATHGDVYDDMEIPE